MCGTPLGLGESVDFGVKLSHVYTWAGLIWIHTCANQFFAASMSGIENQATIDSISRQPQPITRSAGDSTSASERPPVIWPPPWPSALRGDYAGDSRFWPSGGGGGNDPPARSPNQMMAAESSPARMAVSMWLAW